MIQNQILMNITPQETRVCFIERDSVQELHVERTTERGVVGNIYWGKVTRVLPGMQAAFIDIGLARTAFLHLGDMALPQPVSESSRLSIEKIIHQGQYLMVQVAKDALGSKGARLTTRISIAGRFLVFLPNEKILGISQRINHERERDQLRQKIETLFAIYPEAATSGLIVRTEAQRATDKDLASDFLYLINTWRHIYAQISDSIALLHQDLNLAKRILRDYVSEGQRLIQVDSREKFNELCAFAQNYMPDVLPKISYYQGERPIFDLFSVELEIARALEPRVDLKSGGYLVIDQTEAMTTIDINTGAFVGSKNLADTIYKTNLEAAHAIARQIRLRNLGGIILVDFIDMESQEHKAHVLSQLRSELTHEQTRISVSDFSTLGLVEIARKRTRDSLSHQLCTSCPECTGKGYVKSIRSVCYEILREIVRETKQFDPQGFRIVAAPIIVEAFLEEESNYFASTIEFIGKPVTLHAENSYGQERYDIVLI